MKSKKLGNGRWVLGDCLEAMSKIPDSSIDMILCDLPYGTTPLKWDNIIPFNILWQEYKRIIKKNRAIVLFGNNPFTALLIHSNISMYKQALVWNKNRCGSPALAKIRHMQTHEDIVIFGEGKILYNPQMQDGEPYTRQKVKAKKDNFGFGFSKNNYSYRCNGKRYPKSILNISRDFSAQQQVHPTQKPVPLFEYLIKTYSNEGDIVLDNCAGSGTTAIACEDTNRRWICIEKDKEYSNKALNRIRQHIKGKTG